MNAGIAGHAGTPQLKQFLMVNIKTEFPRGISDRAISLTLADGCNGSVRPGLGLKQRDSTGGVPGEADISVTSVKLQAPGVKLSNQPVQAASDKHQAQSNKPQALSHKQQAQ